MRTSRRTIVREYGRPSTDRPRLSLTSKSFKYFQNIKTSLMELMDMRYLLEQFYIRLIIIWCRKILIPWCLISIAKNMAKWMKSFDLWEAASLKNHQELFFDTCIKEPGTHGPRFSKLFLNSWSKDAGHPFYAEVYQEAARLNLEFANQMDACIIR